MDNQKLYNKIMGSISKSVKQVLNEDKHCMHNTCSSIGEPITQFYKGFEIEISRFRCDKCGYEYWSFSIYYPTNSYIQDEDEIERYVSDEHFETDTEAFIAAKEGIDYEINNNR